MNNLLNLKELTLAYLIRNEKLLSMCSTYITAQHIDDWFGRGAGILYKVALDYYKRYSSLIDVVTLQTVLSDKYYDYFSKELTREEVGYVTDLLIKIFSVPDKLINNDKNIQFALDNIKNILNSYCKNKLMQAIISDPRNCDLFELIEQTSKTKQNFEPIFNNGIGDFFPSGWDQYKPIDFIPTYFRPLDTFYGGGMVGGEVYIFMGPFGSCKTTLAVQVSANLVEYSVNSYLTGTYDFKPVVIFISTEMPAAEARLRFLSYMARIPRTRLQSCPISDLSRANVPAATPETEYEKLFFKNKLHFHCEYDRIQNAVDMLNKHFKFVDCSGNDPRYSAVGYNGVRDIAAIIETELRVSPDKIAPIFICIDHASGLATRMLEGSSKYKPTDLRHMLRDTVRQAGQLLAKHYNCPVMIMHQLSGQANTKTPASRLDHTDAAECKSFAEFADFAVVTSRPTEDERQLARLVCSKHRRTPPRGHAIVKIMGEFCHLVDVSDEYTVDYAERNIVHKDELYSIADTTYRSERPTIDIDRELL